MTATSDRDAFIAGCVQLANTPTGMTALQVNNTVGPQVPNWQMRGDGSVVLSWWDLFVLWHYVTMELATQGRGSNRAHGGPVFLPWHRLFLLRLEQRLQTVLGDANFALPYWDWARDRQLGSALWTAGRLGRNRGQVTSGVIGGLRVRLTGRFSTATGRFLEAHQPRPINRAAGLDPQGPQLPTKTQVAALPARRCLRRRRLGHRHRRRATEPCRRLDAEPARSAQPGARLGRWRHGPGHITQRPRLLSQPLQRRPHLGSLDGPRSGPHLRPRRQHRQPATHRATTSMTRWSP